MNNIAPVGA